MSKLNKYTSQSKKLTYLICSRAYRFNVVWEDQEDEGQEITAYIEEAYDNIQLDLTKTQLIELIEICKDIELQLGDKLK